MPSELPQEMGIAELAAHAGVTPRTIRYYVAEGLLPPPSGSGPRRTYTAEHLLRLEAIKRLKEAFLPLAEIRSRLSELTPTELEQLATSEYSPTSQVASSQTSSALEYLASILPRSPMSSSPTSSPRSTPYSAGSIYEPPSMSLGATPSKPIQPRGEHQPRIELPRPMLATGRPGSPANLPPQEAPGESRTTEIWRRVALAPGVELHYQPTNDPRREAAIAHLIRAASSLLASSQRGEEAP